MNTFIKSISEIQPSQLYINKEQFSKAEKYINSVGLDNLEPLPIKKIGQKIFFTDGHAKALALFKAGKEEVKVYWDEEDLDWIQYFVYLNWCEEAGIKQIKDLDDRIINDLDYQRLWLTKCRLMHENLHSDIEEYIHIKTVTNSKDREDICELVLRNLPKWFGIEEALKEYVNGVKDKTFLVAYVGEIPVGFISIKEHNRYTSEVYVIGILKEFHGRGIGKKLIEQVINMMRKKDKKFLTVKTLSESHPDENYKKTRKFYSALEFYPLEEIIEIWGKENPCLFMVKNLN